MIETWLSAWRESRVVIEVATTLSVMHLIPQYTLRGKNEPIIILPGLGCGPVTTSCLRTVLNNCGYDARDWGFGVNWGADKKLALQLRKLVKAVHRETGKKVTLIGWSLGGLYSRAIANDCPQYIEKLIMLGSPHREIPSGDLLSEIFDCVSPISLKNITDKDIQKVKVKPPVDCYNIYSRSDGVVNWQHCIDDNSKNIEINCSHSGMTNNIYVIHTILDILSSSPQ